MGDRLLARRVDTSSRCRADEQGAKRVSSEVVFDDVAPVIPVRDLEAALERYRRLGFNARRYEGPERYGFVERDHVSLHLSEWDEHDPMRTGAVVYLHVSDADAVHAEWSQADVEGRLGSVGDTPYGLREFAFVDPEGTLIRVGSRQATPTDPSAAG